MPAKKTIQAPPPNAKGSKSFTPVAPAAKATITPSKTAPKVVSVIKPPTSWSFSRYSDFKTCPLFFKLKHMDKVLEPKSDAMQKGIDAHEDAEKYIKGQLKKLPPVLMPMKAEFDEMKKMFKAKKFPIIVEDNWAFKADWSETQWNDWTGCWVRIKLDAAHYSDGHTMWVTDWKTGKPSEYKVAEYMEQMELYAVSALLMSAVEEVEVHVRLAFVETGDMIAPRLEDGTELVYTRADLPRLLKEWEKRVRPMMNAKNYPPRPNSSCRWCWYGQAKVAAGGPGLCKY